MACAQVVLTHALEARGMSCTETRRHEPLKMGTDRLLLRAAEHARRGGIEQEDPLLLVDDDDRVRRRLDDAR